MGNLFRFVRQRTSVELPLKKQSRKKKMQRHCTDSHIICKTIISTDNVINKALTLNHWLQVTFKKWVINALKDEVEVTRFQESYFRKWQRLCDERKATIFLNNASHRERWRLATGIANFFYYFKLIIIINFYKLK